MKNAHRQTFNCLMRTPTAARWPLRVFLAVSSLMLGNAATFAGTAESSTECPKFKSFLQTNDAAQLRKRGLYRDESSHRDTFMNVDIDGDDVNDELIVGCPASQATGDPCTASVKLSTGRHQFFQFDFGETYILVRVNGKVYAITNQAKPGQRSIVAFDRNGIHRVCSKL